MSPFTATRSKSVAALGERKLIQHIQRWLGDVSPTAPFGIGDDCAVIPPSRRQQLVTTDPVIYGRHFDDSLTARAVGAKLLKRNLSDIAAMGGRPVAAVLSVSLAPKTSLGWLRGFYLGLADCARRHGVKVVGGDITQAPAGFFGAFLTLHGEAAGPRVVTRQGARVGDAIFVTGSLGGSRAGHHYKFEPRLAEGAWLARQDAVVAMMDVSDGLAKDLGALTPAGAVASIWPQMIPVSAAATAAARRTAQPAWMNALTDGEDYELLFVTRGVDELTFVHRWHRRFKTPLHLLGHFARRLAPGNIDWKSLHGYEHLR
jgi:thiamine-monophosphate kinase